jgi:hypothetical protein
MMHFRFGLTFFKNCKQLKSNGKDNQKKKNKINRKKQRTKIKFKNHFRILN